MRIQFNSGRWTNEEHQGFLRGLEVYGRGNWDAIGIFVPARSPLQIEAHARQHFAEGEITGSAEEFYRYIGSICDAAAILGVLDGLMPVANHGIHGQQQQQKLQACVHREGYQAGELARDLARHGVPYPHRLIWEEISLGKELKCCLALEDFGGVL